MIRGFGDHNPIMVTGHDGGIDMQVLYILWQILTPFMAAFGAALIVFVFYNPKHVAFCVVGLLAMIWPHPRTISLLTKLDPKEPSK